MGLRSGRVGWRERSRQLSGASVAQPVPEAVPSGQTGFRITDRLDPVTDVDPRPLADFPVRHVVTTRWTDNDMYGHVNNAAYYAFFDAAINAWIAAHLPVPFDRMDSIGVVAESGCRFLRPVSFPGEVTIGMRIERVGTSSVTYALGVFEGGDPSADSSPCAIAHWVHVYVDRATGTACPIPQGLRPALDALAEPGR